MEWQRIAIGAVLAVLLIVCAIDILGGSYVSETGTVDGHNWYTTTECAAKDSKGQCVSWETETHYQLIISHGDEVTVADVWLGEYLRRQNGERVQVSFWRGGLVGIKWFVGVGDARKDW